MNINKLPEYFAIKWSSNPLWKDYIRWLNKNYGASLTGIERDSYYGYGGRKLNNWDLCKDSLSYYSCLVTELTLEQWDNIVNKKDEFVLPEKWCVERNSDNYLILNNYFNSKFKKKLADADGYLVSPNYSGSSPKEWAKPIDYTEITFEQFKQYVLKQDNMYTIEDLRNGKCAVINNGTAEELGVVLSAAEGKPCRKTYITLNTSKYYWTKDNYFWSNDCQNKYNLPTQSVKEFIKQININKEIIGYKLVKPEYERTCAKILNYRDDKISSVSINIGSSAYNDLKKAGVLDLWFEPVYKEEKTLPKINGYDGLLKDDYVVYNNCAKFHKRFFEVLNGFTKSHEQYNSNFKEQNRAIKSIKLDSGVEITIEQIKQIYEYIKSKD